jgi:hypothetical protein
MTSPWDLIKSKRYEAAVTEYTRLYQEQGSHVHLHNRGLAHLLMGNYAAALVDFQHAIHDDTSNYIFAGVSAWCLSRHDEAVSFWRAGLSAPYADAAGGVEIPALLLYGGCRLGNPALQNEAIQLLKEMREQDRPIDFVHPGLAAWPGAIVPFLLGDFDQTQLQGAVDDARNDILKQRWQCAADFYVGLHAAHEGDESTFQDSMRRCAASQHGELEHGFYLARWEVDRAVG